MLALGCGGSGNNNPPPPGNHAPTVTASVAAGAVMIGASTQASATATDADNDTLTYSWSQTSPASPQGSFSSSGVASPTWTAPTVAQLTKFTLAVTVSDGKGGTNTGSATVYVKTSTDTSFVAEVLPVFQLACTSCHQDAVPVGSMLLSLEADKAYAQLVNVPARSICAPELRVAPGDPDASVLFVRITGATCGDRMPPAAPTYFDQHPDQLETIRSWIEQGAQQN
jgi:hypothetical protein